jgi:hypothetical protein
VTPLEEIVDRLRTLAIEPAGAICDQPFGRSVTVRDPDGLTIQINEHTTPPTR